MSEASTVVSMRSSGRARDVDEDEGQETEVGGIAADRLRSIVERFERLEEEVKALREDQKDIMAEAKSAGFDVKVVKRVLAIRRMKPEDRQNQDDLLPLYMRALGMD